MSNIPDLDTTHNSNSIKQIENIMEKYIDSQNFQRLGGFVQSVRFKILEAQTVIAGETERNIFHYFI